MSPLPSAVVGQKQKITHKSIANLPKKCLEEEVEGGSQNKWERSGSIGFGGVIVKEKIKKIGKVEERKKISQSTHNSVRNSPEPRSPGYLGFPLMNRTNSVMDHSLVKPGYKSMGIDAQHRPMTGGVVNSPKCSKHPNPPNSPKPQTPECVDSGTHHMPQEYSKFQEFHCKRAEIDEKYRSKYPRPATTDEMMRALNKREFRKMRENIPSALKKSKLVNYLSICKGLGGADMKKKVMNGLLQAVGESEDTGPIGPMRPMEIILNYEKDEVERLQTDPSKVMYQTFESLSSRHSRGEVFEAFGESEEQTIGAIPFPNERETGPIMPGLKRAGNLLERRIHKLKTKFRNVQGKSMKLNKVPKAPKVAKVSNVNNAKNASKKKGKTTHPVLGGDPMNAMNPMSPMNPMNPMSPMSPMKDKREGRDLHGESESPTIPRGNTLFNLPTAGVGDDDNTHNTHNIETHNNYRRHSPSRYIVSGVKGLHYHTRSQPIPEEEYSPSQQPPITIISRPSQFDYTLLHKQFNLQNKPIYTKTPFDTCFPLSDTNRKIKNTVQLSLKPNLPKSMKYSKEDSELYSQLPPNYSHEFPYIAHRGSTPDLQGVVQFKEVERKGIPRKGLLNSSTKHQIISKMQHHHKGTSSCTQFQPMSMTGPGLRLSEGGIFSTLKWGSQATVVGLPTTYLGFRGTSHTNKKLN